MRDLDEHIKVIAKQESSVRDSRNIRDPAGIERE
jgi:hypothetical protein